ncbi:hypothetical protein [Bradyrhizobium sediminis]|uniref:hypothetical protein n=1 Tax=Bradyrhizobium sediminis TaxID=2840469 RepID=UPI00201BAC16|nr:hypothetical protein [Bradyrhizobium sediminis]
MSEQQAEQTSGESGSVSAGPAAPNSSAAAPETLKAATEVESPGLAPGQGEAAKLDAAKAEAPKAETPKAETPKAEIPKPETPKAEALKADAPRSPGKVMIISAGDRAWDGKGSGPEIESEPNAGMFGKRRVSALAAVVALAAVAGALGGALATAGVMHFAGAGSTASSNPVLEASVARIDADLLALKAGVEQTSKAGLSQYNKTSDRLDKVERAQAEPAAKLAKLSEAVEKLRAVPVPVAAAPAAARDVTGSISPPAVAAPVPLPVPKPELARLPTVEGWVLRDVAHGGALIEGRQGIYEVYAGDPVPGLGRIDAIRKQDGRWVVVTSKGLVVAR